RRWINGCRGAARARRPGRTRAGATGPARPGRKRSGGRTRGGRPRPGGRRARAGCAARRRQPRTPGRPARTHGHRQRHARRAAGGLRLTMWIESTIAMRFLRQGRAQTLLILFGIAVGVAVIVFVTALISGLQDNIIDRTLGTQSHVRVEAPREVNLAAPAQPGTIQLVLEDPRPQALRPIDNWLQVQDVLDRLPGVRAVSPVVSGPAFGRRAEAVESVALVGVDLGRYLRVIPLDESMVEGRLEIGSGNAVIGRKLAEDLGLRLGGKLRLEAGDGRDA